MASWRKICVDKQKHSGIDYYISKALVATITGGRLGAVEEKHTESMYRLKRLQVTMDWAMYWFYYVLLLFSSLIIIPC